jgi:CSLREA domain-containing protein
MGPLTRAAATAILALCLTAGPAAAQSGPPQTFTVNTTLDGPDNNIGDDNCAAGLAIGLGCTLRAAIQEANNDTSLDTIVLPPGTYQLTQGGPGEDSSAVGDLDINMPLTINGGGARTTIVQQSPSIPDRVFEVRTTFGQVTLNALTITGGHLNTGNGAGLRNIGPATRLAASAVRDNGGGAASPGAGIENGTGGNLTVDSGLVTGNTTTATQGGGGIFNNGGTLTVVNSTISSNTASSGSAIRDQGAAPTTNVQYSTIAGNSTSVGAAVQRGATGGGMVFRDSIVGPNGGTGTNCAGSIATEGHNIETGTNCSFNDAAGGDRQQLDPGIGPLAYSSPTDQTETHPLQPGSPAINTANNAGCPGTDQRAQPRPAGGTCDVGAFEVQPPPPAQPKPAVLLLDPPSANRTPGDPNTVTATVRNDDGSPVAGGSVRFKVDGANPGDGVVTTDASGAARKPDERHRRADGPGIRGLGPARAGAGQDGQHRAAQRARAHHGQARLRQGRRRRQHQPAADRGPPGAAQHRGRRAPRPSAHDHRRQQGRRRAEGRVLRRRLHDQAVGGQLPPDHRAAPERVARLPVQQPSREAHRGALPLAPPVGQRPRPLPHARPLQHRDRARHHLGPEGLLRHDHDRGPAGCRGRQGPGQAQERDGQGGQALHRAQGVTA